MDFFERFFEHTFDLACIASDTHFLHLSKSWKETLGFTREELIQRPFMSFVHPDDIKKTQAILERQLEREHPVFHFTNRFQCFDGGYVTLEWTAHLDKQSGLLMAIARDVTDVGVMFDHLPIGVLIADDTGYIHRSNPHADKMMKRACAGLFVEDLLPRKMRYRHEKLRSIWHRDPKPGLMSRADIRTQARDSLGREFPVEIALAPYRGTQALIAVRDMSEIVRLSDELAEQNKALQRSNEELEQFAYVASHDLQQPLRIVGNYAQLLEEDYGAEDAKIDDNYFLYLNYIMQNAQRGRDLVDDFLGLCRVQQSDLDIDTVSLEDVVEAAILDCQPRIDATQAEVSVTGRYPVVEVDAGQMRNAFGNLISNAIKFHPKGKKPIVKIRAEETSDACVLVEIADEGVGVAPDLRQKIFGIFERGVKYKEFPGTGMGLAIVKRIIERHGGTVWCTDNHPRGTIFRVKLPLCPTA